MVDLEIEITLNPKGNLSITCACDKGPYRWDKICRRCTDTVLTAFVRLFTQETRK